MRDGARAVTDRVLRLDREEQRAREVVHADDAGGPRVIAHVIGVAMDDSHGEPKCSEHEPAGDERDGEQQDVVAPLGTTIEVQIIGMVSLRVLRHSGMVAIFLYLCSTSPLIVAYSRLP